MLDFFLRLGTHLIDFVLSFYERRFLHRFGFFSGFFDDSRDLFFGGLELSLCRLYAVLYAHIKAYEARNDRANEKSRHTDEHGDYRELSYILSGGGKTVATRYLEDLGAFCVDNLPPMMMVKFMEACESSSLQCKFVAFAVDVRSGVLLKPTNFYGIADVPICEMITKKTGYPAFLRNMMNASALAEKYYGRGRDIEDFVYVGITNGVGAGIVSGGELFSSGSGFEGEFGHSSINYDGPKCSCGNRGCLELYATIPRIIETVNEECTANFTTIEEVSEFCRENAEARHAMYSIMDKLAIALASLVNIVDPVRVIIGDEGSGIGQSMIERLESEVNRRILARNEKHVEIVRSDFGAEVRLIGAATIVADQVFTAQMRIDE